MLTVSTSAPVNTCVHTPRCPAADSPGRDDAKVKYSHHDQGFVVLCNDVVVFDDTGELLPSRLTVPPHRPDTPHRAGRAWSQTAVI